MKETREIRLRFYPVSLWRTDVIDVVYKLLAFLLFLKWFSLQQPMTKRTME